MKKDNLIYIIGAVVIVIASIMKLNHLSGAEFMWSFALVSIVAISIYMAIQNMRMRKRLDELDN